jgi:hypothetical protein
VRFVFLLSCLAAIFLLGSCQKSASIGVKVDSRLASYVPPTSTLLAGVDVDSLTKSAFYKRHENQLNIPAVQDMGEQIGVDPRRDLSDILVAWSGRSPLILASGRFSADKVEPHLLSLGGKRSEYRSQTLFGTGDQVMFFPKNNVAIGGPEKDIRAVIDSGSGGIPQPLLDRLRLVPASDQAWIVSQGLPLDRFSMRSDVESALSNIVSYVSALNAGIGFDTGAHVQADVLCISPEDAKQVHDALRGVIGFARLSTKDDQLGLLKLYDAIQVSYDQQTVHIHADLSPRMADDLIGMLSGMERRGERFLQR